VLGGIALALTALLYLIFVFQEAQHGQLRS
jgi:hypothetical protein